MILISVHLVRGNEDYPGMGKRGAVTDQAVSLERSANQVVTSFHPVLPASIACPLLLHVPQPLSMGAAPSSLNTQMSE